MLSPYRIAEGSGMSQDVLPPLMKLPISPALQNVNNLCFVQPVGCPRSRIPTMVPRQPVHAGMLQEQSRRSPNKLNLNLYNSNDRRRRSIQQHAGPVAVGRLFQGNGDDYDSDNNIVVRSIEQVSQIISQPILDITPDFALGYPIALLLVAVWLPVTTSVLLFLFFALYAFAGRKLILNDDLIDEEEDDDEVQNTDLFALGAAIVSAGLLSPSGDANSLPGVSVVSGLVVSTLGIGLILSILSQNTDDATSEKDGDKALEDPPSKPQISPEEELMKLWDKKFETRQDKNEN